MSTLPPPPPPPQTNLPDQSLQSEDAQPTQAEIDALFKDVTDMLIEQKMSVSQVVAVLVGQGADPQVANEIVTGTMSAIKHEYNKGIAWGIVWAAGGLIVTYIGYEAASNGGTYRVFYGAVLYGGYLFLKSLFGLLSLKD